MSPPPAKPKEGIARWWPLLLAELVGLAGGVSVLLEGPKPGTVWFAVGWALIALGAIVALVGGVIEYRRGTHRVASAPEKLFTSLSPAPLPDTGIAWVAVDPGVAKRGRRTLWLVYLLPVIIGVPFLYVMFSGATATPAREAGIVNRLVMAMGTIYFLASVVVAFVVYRWTLRKLRMRLGADHTCLHFDPGTGEIEREEWRAVLTDRTSLLIGRRLVRLVEQNALGYHGYFSVEELRGLILARIPPGSVVSRGALHWKALLRGNRLMRSLALSLLLAIGLQVFDVMHPGWSKGISAAFRACLLRWAV